MDHNFEQFDSSKTLNSSHFFTYIKIMKLSVWVTKKEYDFLSLELFNCWLGLLFSFTIFMGHFLSKHHLLVRILLYKTNFENLKVDNACFPFLICSKTKHSRKIMYISRDFFCYVSHKNIRVGELRIQLSWIKNKFNYNKNIMLFLLNH